MKDDDIAELVLAFLLFGGATLLFFLPLMLLGFIGVLV